MRLYDNAAYDYFFFSDWFSELFHLIHKIYSFPYYKILFKYVKVANTQTQLLIQNFIHI